MTDEQAAILELLEVFVEARAELRECRKLAGDEYAWDADEQRVDDCADAFFASLDAYIDARIARKR